MEQISQPLWKHAGGGGEGRGLGRLKHRISTRPAFLGLLVGGTDI